jgi:hypothetical protein
MEAIGILFVLAVFAGIVWLAILLLIKTIYFLVGKKNSVQQSPKRKKSVLLYAGIFIFLLVAYLVGSQMPDTQEPTPSQQTESAREPQKAPQQLSTTPKRPEPTKQQTQAGPDPVNNFVAKMKSIGYVTEIDCSLANVSVDPAGWYAMDLEQKRNTSAILMKYCETRGGYKEILHVRNRMDGKELGGFGLMGFTVN